MSLTLKLLSTTILASSALLAVENSEVIDFVKNNIARNPNITINKLEVKERINLDSPKNWSAFIIDMKLNLNQNGVNRVIDNNEVVFATDGIIAPDLIDMKTGQSIRSSIGPKFKDAYYKDANRIYGNKDAKHKVVIFSDPQCPFCINYVPEILEYVNKYPKTFAVYYYHFPLTQIHPAAMTISKAMLVAEHMGIKDVTLKVYKANMTMAESDTAKILKEFNKVVGSNITVAQIEDEKITKAMSEDMSIAGEMMVQGTPTLYFDGKKIENREFYKNVKTVD